MMGNSVVNVIFSSVEIAADRVRRTVTRLMLVELLPADLFS